MKYNGDIHGETNQKILGRLVDREVICNLCYTVDLLTKCPEAQEVGEVDEETLYGLCERIDYAEAAQAAGWVDAEEEEGTEYFLHPKSDETNTEAEDWQELCEQEGIDIDDYRSEALEFWAVTPWFTEQLKAQGEATGEVLDFHVWGRTCSGQAIALDCVIGRIAADMGILEGQQHDWSK